MNLMVFFILQLFCWINVGTKQARQQNTIETIRNVVPNLTYSTSTVLHKANIDEPSDNMSKHTEQLPQEA